ncbi:unnamed protein product [Blepharisma stoltei]|uniref:Uncharacterized protein n=1 Tax=Blepharisma stoltei TaxID=1481888 RepID=A0AAU9IV41_9CILI|nr:unnamed protein product [Blepharisma stoltei]
MLNNGQLGMVKLRNSSIDRLMLIHGTDYNTETNAEILKHPHSIRKAHSSLHLSYAWRILAFFIISASYYFLVYFYIYKDCEEMMINRPSLLNNFNLRRVLISRLSIFSREAYLPYMNTLFKTSYAFPNPQKMVENTYTEFMIKTKELRNKNFCNLMSQELIDRIYETTESDTNALDQGSYPLANDVVDEIYSLKNTKFTTKEHSRYNSKITEAQDEILQEFLLADHDSKNIIKDKLNIIINATVFYTMAVLFLFFFYYWPFFIAQAAKLNKLSMLQSILLTEAE